MAPPTSATISSTSTSTSSSFSLESVTERTDFYSPTAQSEPIPIPAQSEPIPIPAQSEPIPIPAQRPNSTQTQRSEFYTDSPETRETMAMSNEEILDQLLGEDPTIWVFGYGSLLWKPDFSYKSKRVGFIDGYVRRFYQGNITFRGKPGKPGRVANLVEDKESRTWGVAFEISGRQNVEDVLKALYTREAACGGYVTEVKTFFPREWQEASLSRSSSSTSTCSLDKDTPEVSSSLNSNTSSFPSSPGVQFHLGASDDSEETEENYEENGEFVDKIFPATKFPADETTPTSFSSKTRILSKSLDSSQHSRLPNTSSLSGLSLEAKSLADLHAAIYRSRSDFALNLRDNESQENVLLSDIPHSFSNLELSSETSASTPMSSFSSRSGSPFSENDFNETEDASDLPAPVQVLLYTATPDNDLYLGEDDLDSMARQIVDSEGYAGTNIEYVTKIADYIRQHIPEDDDHHLFQLDAKIREEVFRRNSYHMSHHYFDFHETVLDIEAKSVVRPVQAS